MGTLQAGHPLAREEEVVITHLVLFRPPADLSDSDRQTLLDAMRTAFTGIAEIRRVRIGKQIGRAHV